MKRQPVSRTRAPWEIPGDLPAPAFGWPRISDASGLRPGVFCIKYRVIYVRLSHHLKRKHILGLTGVYYTLVYNEAHRPPRRRDAPEAVRFRQYRRKYLLCKTTGNAIETDR